MRGVLRIGCVALALTIIGSGVAGGARTTEPAHNTCRPRGSQTLTQNAQVRVYRLPVRRAERGFVVYACAFSNGQRQSLDDGLSSYAFLPPAISVRGRTVGYASTDCDFSAGGHGCETSVAVIDPSLPPSLDPPIRAAEAGPSPGEAVKVGSLRHKSNGAIAWIQCPEPLADGSETQIRGDRGPTCVRPGNADRVYKLDADTKRRIVLDRGKHIYPGSLRLDGSRLSWRSAGRTRHATLR